MLNKYTKDLLKPIQLGGNQESSFRSGTEAVPLIAGFAKAVNLIDNYINLFLYRYIDIYTYR